MTIQNCTAYCEVYRYDAPLASNEWLVAMRVGVGKYNDSYHYDYHFWYRASDGKWYNKHGHRAASEMVSGNVTNPSNANSSDGWSLDYFDQKTQTIKTYTNFYSSSTAYYAVKK